MRTSFHRIWGLVIKELLQLSRDKLLLGFILIAPILELALMGGLSGDGVQNLPLAVVDLDRSRASREVVAKLDQTEELLIKNRGDDVDQARRWMQSNQIAVIVVVPPGYGESLADPQRTTEIQVIADGSSHVVSTVAIATAENVAAEVVRDLTARHALASSGPVEMRFAARFNALLDNRFDSITTMLGLIVYQIALIIAAQGFTRERELGTLEQLRVTPLAKAEMIAGKAIPTLLIGLIEGLALTVVAHVWFDIPVHGSLPLLMLLTIPYIMVQIGWGTLISLVSRTQQQAMLFVFALAMLEIACSGFLVPANSLPTVMQWISNVSSVQHYMAILRGVLLRDAGLEVLWQPALMLSAIALVMGTLAWFRLRLGLDADSPRRRLKTVWQAYRLRRRQAKNAKRKESSSYRKRRRRLSGETA